MSETTGQHATQPAPTHPELEAIRSTLWRQAMAIVGAGVIGFGGTSIGAYATYQADRARDEEIHDRLERDLARLERNADSAATESDSLRGDLAALKATYEAGQADTRSRLVRIEAALDGRRR